MSARSNLVSIAQALVNKFSVLSLRDSRQIILTVDLWLSTKVSHDVMPFLSMRANIFNAKYYIGYIMGDFVRYSILQVIFKVFGKQVRVVAYVTSASVEVIHPGSTAS